jgi:outer membrane protein TolC
MPRSAPPWILAAAVVAAFPAVGARAGEAAPLRLTLAEAQTRAIAVESRAGQWQSLEASAAANVQASSAARLPQLELAGGYTRQSDVPELTLALPGAPPRTIFPNIPDNYRLRIGVSAPLYTGGRLHALSAAARAERTAAQADVASGRSRVLLETAAAYWGLVTARETARVLGESLAAYETDLLDARNRERLGLAARNEVLVVEVERDQAELARLRAESRAAVAEAQLARLLDAAPGARLEPAEELEGPAAGDPELESLVAEALAARPERAALAAHLAAAEARISGERAARLPQVQAAAGLDYARPNRKVLPPEDDWKDTWDVSVNVSWSLFDGGRAGAALRRARAAADGLRHQLAELDRLVRFEVTQSAAELTTARAATAVATRSRAAALENRRVARDRHREGLIPWSEVLDAEVAVLRADLSRTEALAQVRLAAAALDRARGR